MNPPQTQDHPQWCKHYIELVETDVLTTLAVQANDFTNFVLNHGDKENYAYAPGKWTIKEMLGHIIDTERVLFFRLMCFARGERQSLPGFDEDNYVKNARFSELLLQDLCDEFVAVRSANMYLLRSLNEEELDRKGFANNQEISARALVFVLAGHVIHHQNIIKERYL
jgi:hypothetical protein